MIVALDTGKARTAAAYFEGEICVKVGFLVPPTAMYVHTPSAVSLVVVEKPRINSDTPNWESVFDCGWYGALVVGAFRAPVVEYSPSGWKASTKKPLHHKRLWRVMLPSERALFPEDTWDVIEHACAGYARTGKVTKYSHEWHNTLDAVGIGLFHFGRTGRGGSKR